MHTIPRSRAAWAAALTLALCPVAAAAQPAGQNIAATASAAPILVSPPDVVDAPGQGMVPGISDHLGTGPTLYRLDAQPIEQMSPLIQRQYLHGTQSTFVKWIVKKGAVVPLHHHSNEQITWIVQGEAEVYSQGRKYVVAAGEIIIFPPNVPHEFRFTQDSIDIDFFSPQRQDWMDGTARYYTTK